MRIVIDTNEKKTGSLLDFAPSSAWLAGREWLPSVDVSSVANTQNHDLIPLNVKHNTVVADTKSV